MKTSRWRKAGGALGRLVAVWGVSTLTMLALAGILPDFRLQSAQGDDATTIGVTAAYGAGAFGLLSVLVWPILVRTLLLVPALVLGLLVFFLNGSLLLIALRLNPSGRGEVSFETAVAVAAVMSAVASATGGALAVRDDDAYRRRLHRLAVRRGKDGFADSRSETPGTLFLQFDGVGHDVLTEAVAEGRMPTLGSWLGGPAPQPSTPDLPEAGAPEAGAPEAGAPEAGAPGPSGPPGVPPVAAAATHRLVPWRTDWSSQTGASQLGILHGDNHDVPAFRWYDKDTKELVVCNRPASAAQLERRAVAGARHEGLLAVDGASRGNLFSGGARQLALVLSVAARRGRSNRSRAGYFAYFSDPANAVRTALSFTAEVGREISQSTAARLRKEHPRVGRGGLYPFVRAFATVVQRDVVVASVVGDMFAGRRAVYADLVGYDEVSHHSGPRSSDALKVLQRLDRSLALLAKVAAHAPRPYRIVVLSDHGQSPGETFRGRYGLGLADLVRAGCGLPVSRRARRTRSGTEARAAVRAALHRRAPEEPGQPPRGRESEPVILASGNLGLVSFRDVPGRMTLEEIEARHPALVATLANHPGIGFVLGHSRAEGSVVLGPHGLRVPLDRLDKEPGPLAVLGPGAAEAVRRTDTFEHVADLMVNSSYDPDTGEVHAFEEQIGSHGGLGGDQSLAFLLAPLDLSPPAPDGENIVGAVHVHRVLARWLAEADGPQVPLVAGPAAP